MNIVKNNEIFPEDIWNDEKKEAIKKAILEHKKYNLFLDDFRHPYDCICYMDNKFIYSQFKWIIVKDYNQFVDKINELGLPELISFDHDLADEHYAPEDRYDDYDVFSQGFKEKTGLDCAKWLVQYCKDNELNLPKFEIHSMNKTGAKNIRLHLENF